MSQLVLEQNEEGQVVQVITSTVTDKVVISSAELQRQIDEHQSIVNTLQEQYNIVKDFEDSVNVVPTEEATKAEQ